MKKKITFGLFMIIAIITISVSCSKQLLDEDIFTNREHGMSRYLSGITEYVYPTHYDDKDGRSTVLFSKPEYDDMNRVTSVYCNLWGENSNNFYSYKDSEIIASVSNGDGTYETRTYHMKNNIICDGMVTTDSRIINYKYEYDNESNLIKVIIDDGNGKSQIEITWKDGNVINIKETNNHNYVTEEKYEYQYRKKYISSFSMFHLATLNLGINAGIDQILSSEGYFGNIVSKDLPIKEFYIGVLSREFKYNIDKSGYITKIEQIYKNKVVREYDFNWN